MSPLIIGLSGFGAVLVLIAMRIPIGISLGFVAVVGIAAIRGPNAAYAILRNDPFLTAAHFSLSAIPMFILMGAFANYGGLSAALFRAARAWLHFLPGGLAIATNMACAGFSAASGSSLATTAAISRITIPQMLESGYDKGLATGSVAAGGTLGVMIPPSLVFIIYGIFAEVPISQLFIAGILPGVLTLVVYCTMILIRCNLNPALAPKSSDQVSWDERWRALAEIWPILALVLSVIGAIYTGIATPTEAGALGALTALIVSFLGRKFTLALFFESINETAITTARIFFIVIGAVLFSRFMAQAGVASYFAELIVTSQPSQLTIILFSAALFILLGMFLDTLGLLLLTLPLLIPMYQAADLNMLWFGVLTVKFVEIGMITPPVGLNVYVIKGTIGGNIKIEEIFKGCLWFLLCEVLICTLLITVPDISLILVRLMG